MPLAELQQAQLLLEQRRYKEAETLLRKAIDATPDNGELHACLALALVYRQRFEQAADEAKIAIAQAPDNGFCYYVRALALLGARLPQAALESVYKGLELDRQNTLRYLVLAGLIYYHVEDWPSMLQIADQALQWYAQSAEACAIRGIALWKMEHKREAEQAFTRAQTLNPHHPLTLAGQGWLLLESGEYRAAQEHFLEALRLDPFVEWARDGLIEVLKARNSIYRPLLDYTMFMASREKAVQIGALLAIYPVLNVGSWLIKILPVLKIPLDGLVFIYLVFAFTVWMSWPLSRLLLRLHPVGRHALWRSEVTAANWAAVCLLAALGFLIAGLATGLQPWLYAAMGAMLMTMSVTGIFRANSVGGRGCLTIITLVLLGLAIAAVATGLAGSDNSSTYIGIFGGLILLLALLEEAMITIEL